MALILENDKTLGKNVPLMLRSRMQECPDVVLQYVKNDDKKYDTYTYRRVYTRVVELAAVLKKFGIKRGDRVGLISDNRREWLVTDLALLSLGAADVPRGCDSMGSEIRFILSYVECAVCFFENARQLQKVLEKIEEVPLLKDAVLFDSADAEIKSLAEEKGIRVHKFIDLEDEGRKSTEDERKSVEEEMDKTSPDEIATIIFTSGTTGNPKGVMLSHDSYIAQCEVIHEALPFLKQGDIWLSILPVWHSFERAVNYLIIALKNGMIYSRPAASVMLADMEALHPNTMCGVPRLWESVAQGFFSAMKKKGGITLALFDTAVSVGKVYNWAKDRVFGLICRYRKTMRLVDTVVCIVPFLLLAPINALFDLIIFKKIRAKFGGNMHYAISGGGSLQPDTDAFYHAINFKLLEGYGITEAGPILSVRRPYKPRSGCVGQVYASAQVKIVAMEDGKILSQEPLPPGKTGLVLAKGRQIMKGYYKNPELTEKTIDKDGWLNTGDIGMMTYDNEIKIIGRAKDTIVLLGGENIEPLPIEQAACTSSYIETVVLEGQDQKYIAALVVPSKDAVIAYAEENRIVFETYEALLESNEIQSLIRGELDKRICAEEGFRPCEYIYKFVLLPESFEQGKEINAKMEVMRHKVVKIYEKQIKSLFSK
ncbi:long-chain fatty acid--CoA ligase [Treponema parvum]|uniref:Long-chain fatty acid--CoA ligase n=1 Tax=Treponema parvum TaxID=138851 RepID=A0A975F469_9SPIR|nr:long-chain fatty acid--CoA ligase [Treponema parvum]QTQ14137.1 long-chain fatty acid--CoA ligase [Treponema parvum]